MFTTHATSMPPLSFSARFGYSYSARKHRPGDVSWRDVQYLRTTSYPSEPDQNRAFEFGVFCLLPQSRTLLQNERPIECGSRAFDLLHVLLLSRGKIVSKEEIVRHVWPTTCVDESNLRFQMASLRKILGTHRDLIKTIPGRGYLLVSESHDEVYDRD